MPVFTRPVHESNDCHDPQTGRFCSLNAGYFSTLPEQDRHEILAGFIQRYGADWPSRFKQWYDTQAYKSPGERDAAEGRVQRATPAAFKKALLQNSRAETLTDYSTEELQGMKLFMLKGGKAGYAIKNGSELVNLFNNGGEATKGAGPWLVIHAIENGARHGDHFDGFLTGFYQKLGFTQVRREANWTPGGPDVVYMRFTGGDPRTVRERYRRDGRVGAD